MLVWLTDRSPGGDVHRRIGISGRRVPAEYTEELTLTATIAFVNTTAYRTGTRRVTRVNRNDAHPVECGLVLDLLPKVKERPVSVTRPLLASEPLPVADTSQIFDCNSTSGAMRFRHDTLTDAVVNVLLVKSLLVGDLLELALRSPRAFSLQVSPAVGIPAALAFDLLSAVYFTVAVYGKVYNAKIDTEIPVNVFRVRCFHFTGNEQVERSLDEAQVSLSPASFKKDALTLAAQVRHTLTTPKSPDTYGLLCGFEAENTVVVRESATQLERSPSSLIYLVGVGHLPDGAHRHLGRQVVTFANRAVGKVMQRILSENPSLPRLLAYVVAGSVGYLKRLEQYAILLVTGLKFDLSYQLHIGSITHQLRGVKSNTQKGVSDEQVAE